MHGAWTIPEHSSVTHACRIHGLHPKLQIAGNLKVTSNLWFRILYRSAIKGFLQGRYTSQVYWMMDRTEVNKLIIKPNLINFVLGKRIHGKMLLGKVV